MKVTRDSHPDNRKSSDDKKRKRTLGKLFSAFGRAKKTTSSPSSQVTVVDVPQMASSPRVNISSVSSTSSYGECAKQSTGRVTMDGAELAPGQPYISAELSEKGTQTAALSAPSAAHYRRHPVPSDTSYSSYPNYHRGYPTSRAKCEVGRHAAEMAAPSWRRTASLHHRQPKRTSANEMDILSFFDTGSVDHGYAYKCAKEKAAESNDAYAAREAREGAVQRLPSSDSQSRQQLMLEDKDHFPGQRRSHTDCQLNEMVENPACSDDLRPAPFHLQTVKSGKRSDEAGPTSFWYCEKMDKNKAKRIPDATECEPTGCCEQVVEPTRLQQSGGSIFNRQITTEEKRRLAKIGAIILATAGVAALIMLLVKYRRQAQLCKSMMVVEECETKSCDTFDDDDDGVCIFEKFDKVKCQNENFKAMMSNSEKLIEHEDRVCASQDFKKVTKRLKGQSEVKAKEIFCPCAERECSDINKKKCFDNF